MDANSEIEYLFHSYVLTHGDCVGRFTKKKMLESSHISVAHEPTKKKKYGTKSCAARAISERSAGHVFVTLIYGLHFTIYIVSNCIHD